MGGWIPALLAWISGSTMWAGFTFRKRIPKSVAKDTLTPEARAVTHNPMGMNRKKMDSTMKPRTTAAMIIATESSLSFTFRSMQEVEAAARPEPSERCDGIPLSGRP